MSSLIVIPARGGSKGIPRKNLRLLAGRPLLGYAIDAALAVRHESSVVVSTEDPEVAEYATTLGVSVLNRPPDLALAVSTVDSVALDAARRMPGDYVAVATVQPTSPFVTGGDIDAAYDALMESDANVVFAVTDDTHLTWGFEGETLLPLYGARVNRQLQPRRLRETGSVVCTRRAVMLAHGTRFVPPYAVIEIDPARAIDIDDRTHWAFAESVFAMRSVTIVTSGAARTARQLTLALGLAKHEIEFVVAAADESARTVAERMNYPVKVVETLTGEAVVPYARDVVICDAGETGERLADHLTRAGCAVLTFTEHDTSQGGDRQFSVPYTETAREALLSLLPRLTAAIESSARRTGHANG